MMPDDGAHQETHAHRLAERIPCVGCIAVIALLLLCWPDIVTTALALALPSGWAWLERTALVISVAVIILLVVRGVRGAMSSRRP